MKHDDEMVLREIQKNTQMGMTAIDTILDKIGNDDSRQQQRNHQHVEEFKTQWPCHG